MIILQPNTVPSPLFLPLPPHRHAFHSRRRTRHARIRINKWAGRIIGIGIGEGRRRKRRIGFVQRSPPTFDVPPSSHRDHARAHKHTHTNTSAFFNKYTTKTLSTRRHTRYVTHYKARVKHITALFSKVREESPRRRENPRREGSDTRSVLR